MPKVAIVTDSTADFPVEYIEKYDITVVPLSVIFDETAYIDNGIDITKDEFYGKLKTSKKLPTTAQPTPADFAAVYEKLLKDHESIISVHISKKMSGTHDSAEAAKKELGPTSDITVIDSGVTTIALGLIILKAARLASEDNIKEEVLKEINDLKSKIDTLFIPRTLEYLQKGGRIGRAKGLIASLLEIKPVLTLRLGEVSQYKTTRRWNQAKNELTSSMQGMIKGTGNLKVAVADADLRDEGDEVYSRIMKLFKPSFAIRTTIGCVVGTHLGPGLAIAFYEE
jgi:DegV family protein with EDD domain